MNNLRPLSTLLCEAYPLEIPVAYRRGEVLTHRRFLEDVSRLSAAIQETEKEKWILHSKDSYNAAIGFFALLQAKKKVILPANILPTTLSNIQAEAILCDVLPPTTPLVHLDFDGDPTTTHTPFDALDGLSDDITLWTSGSTGMPKAISKRLNQLEQEIAILHRMWGERLDDACVLATVSHQHIYGLLFRVLWPLSAGCPFVSSTVLAPSDIATETLQKKRVVLVSSPSLLQRFPNAEDWPRLSNRLSGIFSSGSPLATDKALEIHKNMHLPVTEVLGSSETGGIAFRESVSLESASCWTPLPSVDVREGVGHALELRSPFLKDRGWYTTDDSIEMTPSGQFLLGRRLDDIVKIEGKRISLSEVEHHLTTCGLVNEAKVIKMTGRRSLLASVVLLSPQGWKLIERKGKSAVNSALRSWLGGRVEAVCVPKKWRYIQEFPQNSEGKTPQSSLKEMFILAKNGPLFPEILRVRKDSSSCWLTLSIPGTLFYFSGHFPGRPILPGVVQLDWALHFAKQYLGVSGRFGGADFLKFSKIIEPGALMTLNLVFESGKLSFFYSNTGERYSSGRVLLNG